MRPWVDIPFHDCLQGGEFIVIVSNGTFVIAQQRRRRRKGGFTLLLTGAESEDFPGWEWEKGCFSSEPVQTDCVLA